MSPSTNPRLPVSCNCGSVDGSCTQRLTPIVLGVALLLVTPLATKAEARLTRPLNASRWAVFFSSTYDGRFGPWAFPSPGDGNPLERTSMTIPGLRIACGHSLAGACLSRNSDRGERCPFPTQHWTVLLDATVVVPS